MKKVILGMSGGVDSSVAGLLLKEQGYEVIGIFMKNYSDSKNKFTGECSWRDEKRMAQRVAILLEIPLLVIDYEKEYKTNVITPMFKDYAYGLTPNPDILCNKIIKFPALWKEAKKLGADFIATGHYARIKGIGKRYKLLMGRDKEKDQSYFLCELTQKDLSHTLFPIGDLTKKEVREIAKRNKFPNWDKKGTSGICFIGNINMKKFLRKRIREKKGRVLSFDGQEIGTHPGAMFFTIGERVGSRKGFRIDGNWIEEISKLTNPPTHPKLYIAKKLSGNRLVVAPEGHRILKTKQIFIKGFGFIRRKETKRFKARIRHLGRLYGGRLSKKGSRWGFKFNQGVEGVAEGQSIVLYEGQEVVGCGEIRLK